MEKTTLQHSENCRYKDDDKLAYAYFAITDETRILIAASEIALFDEYLEYAKADDKNIIIDHEQPDHEPFQIMYGGIMFDEEKVSVEKVMELANELKGYSLYDLEAEGKVNVSGYTDIVFYPEDANSKNFIPFAAFIQTPHRLIDTEAPKTLFPAFANYRFVWEKMVNRPFLFACRESFLADDCTVENWKEKIDKDRLMAAYNIADLVIYEDD